jgi:hypothetical protein
MGSESDNVVESMRQALHSGTGHLKHVPGLLKRILREGMWRSRYANRLRREVTFDRFEDFVVTAPLEGLGATVDLVRKFVRDDPEALSLFDQAVQRPVGANQHSEGDDNVHTQERPTGNSRERALRKLRRDAPELHALVLAGEVSPHGAMKQAGFRKDPTPLIVMQRAWKRASEEERSVFLRWVEE